jgi:hypothetical protein
MIKKKTVLAKCRHLYQQTSVAEEHLEKGHCLLEEHTLNKVKLLIYRAELEIQQFQNSGAEFRAKVNFNKEHCIKVIPPITSGVQF